MGSMVRLGWLALGIALVACGGQTLASTSDGGPAGGGSSGSSGSSGAGDTGASVSDSGTPINPTPANKVDLLFMIDNTPTMDEEESLLALAVPTLLTRLASPECLSTSTGRSTGTSADGNGNCPAGSKAQFPPVTDMHVGIVSSSLGSRGGNVCPDGATNPVNPALNAHNNDNGELIARSGMANDPTVESSIPDAPAPLNFLSYFPNVTANSGHPTPPTPSVPSASQLVSDFTSLVYGVHDHGCGFKGQNEAWYRFLVQPDPFATINVSSEEVATVAGIDETILEQRASFLRPDSVVVVIVVTSGDEKLGDPLSVNGQGWAFSNEPFPGSPTMSAPEGTIQCSQLDPSNPSTTGPNDPNCTSCAFCAQNASCNENLATECPNDPPAGMNGYLDPSDDGINIRYFHQKERFGLQSSYPVSRYIRGLSKTTVPSVGLAYQGDTDHEHDGMGDYVGDQDANADCVNPLFAQNLPTSATADLCHLMPGPRGANHVFYATIAGVPHQLLQTTPGENDMYGSCPAGTPAAQCPQKTTLSSADWTLILGNNPVGFDPATGTVDSYGYDFSGADYHMIESEVPRTTNTGNWGTSAANGMSASPCPPPAQGIPSATCDPWNGSEYDTNKAELEFACIFPLVDAGGPTITPFMKDCTQQEYDGACSCANGLDAETQLCDPTTPTTQIYTQAYPSVREMAIAKAMATQTIGGQVYDQSIVSSACPITVDVGQPTSQALADPLFGYNPAMNAIVDRIAGSL
jgi:hypothetical protein